MARILPVLLATILAAAAWAGGEQHRGNCLTAGHTGCSVLPWDNGTRPANDALRGLSPSERRALQREFDAAARNR